MEDRTSIMTQRYFGFFMASIVPLLGSLLMLIDALTLQVVSIQRIQAFISVIQYERLLNQVVRWVDPLDREIIKCSNCRTCFEGKQPQVRTNSHQLFIGMVNDTHEWCICLIPKTTLK